MLCYNYSVCALKDHSFCTFIRQKKKTLQGSVVLLKDTAEELN